jgi:hypothetical protein
MLYLRRWIRCLTAREFHIEDALKVIDSIFFDYFDDQ